MTDETVFMARALELAARSAGHTRPNPPVGAVVVKDGRIVGEGRHRRCGGPHAEAAALASCRVSPRGATVYCTLEPCSKPGRVGACCDALVAAGIARVVWAIPDPNPVNRGKAVRILRRAGMATECWAQSKAKAKRDCAERAERIISPFACHVLKGRPYVTVKIAMSLDGRICDDAGDARWVSSAAARRETGHLRESVDVVMVGAETVRRDNPSLLCHTRRNDDLWRAVISKSGRLPRNARIFTDAARDRTLVYADIAAALADLGRRGFLHVLCEGGLELARSLAAADCVDEWITVFAPKVIGHSPIAGAKNIARTVLIADRG